MFKIGDKVICIKTHSMGVVKEGKIYNIALIREFCCYRVSVGVKYNGYQKNTTHIRCQECSKIHPVSEYSEWWLSHELFRKIDESFSEQILENIKEQIYKLI